MASEDTLIGNDLVLQIGDDSSPIVYTDMCSVFDPGTIGEEKPTVDVTALCDRARAYRNGLADGSEIQIQANNIIGDENAQLLYTAFKNDEVVNFRLLVRDQSPEESYEFRAIVRAWNVNAPVGDRSVKGYTLKVSGEVTWNFEPAP